MDDASDTLNRFLVAAIVSDGRITHFEVVPADQHDAAIALLHDWTG
jgi:hypothetical protein